MSASLMDAEMLLKQLGSLRPQHATAAAIRDCAVRLALGVGDVTLRNHPSRIHLTASAVVVDPESEQVLLLWHPRYQRWLQPGGHCDGEKDLAAVALREVQEESGLQDTTVAGGPIDIDMHEGEPGRPAHHHIDVRFSVVTARNASRLRTVSPEGHELCWVDASQIQDCSLRNLAISAIQNARSHSMRLI
jgi:8-oxo-dGTP pyrophosphatase MutT (NUDIX family)